MVRDEWSSVYAVGCPTGSAATKQSTWDRAVTALERQTVINSLSNATDRARLLSVTSPHSSDWLHALPLSGCGRRLDDRAIHIAVGLGLGANICEPHQCPCRAPVDARGLHGLSQWLNYLSKGVGALPIQWPMVKIPQFRCHAKSRLCTHVK